ncbi:MAG: proton-conducting transporter membrane subunit [Candidatus Omnitrophota bacterium]
MASFLIIAPLLGVLALNVGFKSLMKRCAFWVAAAFALLQLAMVFLPITHLFGVKVGQFGTFLVLPLAIDGLSLTLFFCIGIILLVTLMIVKSSKSDPDAHFTIFNLLLIILSGLNGIVAVTDIFSLYVFLEIVAVASFILIASGQDQDAFEGAFKYIILSAVASALILSAIALLVLITGSTSFAVIHAALAGGAHGRIVIAAVVLLIAGFCIKGGLVPFHGWLPDAYMSAPAGISVLLAGIVTKTAGIYPLVRLLASVIGISRPVGSILLIVGTVSIVIGALAAMGQRDMKRMLAYSSISQMGYILLGLGCGSWFGFVGAVFHLFNHAIFKSLLFVNSASVESQTGTRDMASMGGLAARMPISGATSIIAALSAAGVPPLAGFWSKLIIIIALWLGGYHLYAVIAVLASVLTLAYLLSMQRMVFFGKINETYAAIEEARGGLVISALVLAAITVGVGVLFPFVMKYFMMPGLYIR